MDDARFWGFVFSAVMIVFFLWLIQDRTDHVRECESKTCPMHMTPKYMQTGEYANECLCVVVPR